MSQDLVVYLKLANMPSPEAWHSAIVDAGFPVALYTDFDVESFSGFLPCTVNGDVSGFEYYASTVSPADVIDLELVPGTDFSVQLSFGSRPQEITSALAASSVLAAASGGYLDEPQAGKSIAASAAVSWAKTQLARMGAE